MHSMSGSAVDNDRLMPVRLNPEMFSRNRAMRTRSPGSPKPSPSPQELSLARPAAGQADPGQRSVTPSHALPTFDPAGQARVLGPPVQVLSSALSRRTGASSTMLASGMFLQVTARAKNGPLATSSGSPSAFSSKLPTGSQALPRPLKLSSVCTGGSDPGRGVGLLLTAQLSCVSVTASMSWSSSTAEQTRPPQTPAPPHSLLNVQRSPGALRVLPAPQVPWQSPSQRSPSAGQNPGAGTSLSVCAPAVSGQLSATSGVPSRSRSGP